MKLSLIFRLRSTILMVIALLVLIPVSAKNRGQSKTIVIVNAHTDNSSWSNEIIPRITNMVVYDLGLEVYPESMEMMLIDQPYQLNAFKKYLFAKYTPQPAVVVMIGSSALVLRDDIRKHWGDIPIVLCSEESFCGPETYYLQKKMIPTSEQIHITSLSRDYNLTQLYSPIDIEGNINLMLRMKPEMNRLIVLSGPRTISRHLTSDIQDLVNNKYPQLKIETFTAGEIKTRKLLNYLDTVDPKTTGVLLDSWYHVLNTTYSKSVESNAITLIANTPIPIFAPRHSMLNDGGYLGGYISDQRLYNDHLIDVLKQIINGKQAREIPFYYASGFHPAFNYRAMQYFGVDSETLPSDTEILGMPPTFWQSYRYQIIVIIVLIICAVILIAYQSLRVASLKKLRDSEFNKHEAMAAHSHLVHHMPIIYTRSKIIRDAEGVPIDAMISDTNPAFDQTFSELGDAKGKLTSELFPTYITKSISVLRMLIEQGKTCIFPYYAPERGKHFEIIVSRTSGTNMLDTFCIDTTELHRTQEQLAATNHKLAMAIEVSNITPWRWDLQNQTIFFDVSNKNAHLLASADIDDTQLSISTEQYFARIHPEDYDRIRKAYDALIDGKIDKVHEEYRILSKNNKHSNVEWIEVQGAIDQRNSDGTPQTIIGSTLVITNRKTMETELVSAMEQAEESNRLKSAFLANMSHEIRTPLNAIVGFSSMIADTEELDEKQEYLGIIQNNNELLLQLIGDILDLSKIEAGTLDFVYSDVELNHMLAEIESIMRLRMHNKAVTLNFDASQAEVTITTSPNRLAQVINNLLTNAIKFTSNGSIHFGYEIQGDMLHFYVTDTGCGIPQEKLSKIFERFVKLNNFEQGTGLGLAICQTIIEHMGGKVGAESEIDKGSTFWFTIPYKPTEQKLEEEEADLTPTTIERDKLTILVAEDNPSNYKLMESILGKEYKLLHAWNGQEAIELYKEHSPHLILMDLNMPVMNGYEATKAIREISKSIPIIAVTAFAYASDEQQVMASGFDNYIPKPINPEKLRTQIVKMLHKRMIFFC